MKYRRKNRKNYESTPLPKEIEAADACPRGILIVGAGGFLHDTVALIGEYPEFLITGILDPAPALKGQRINGIPVTGWLGDISTEDDLSAIVVTPSSPGAFDRESVFQILMKRGISLPILQSRASRCARDVILRRGTALFPDTIVRSGALLGQNCLVGTGCVIGQGVELDDHSAIMPGQTLWAGFNRKPQNVESRNLSSTLAGPDDSIQEIIHRINRSGMEIALITDKKGAILGTVTDGDIRRGILAGLDMRQPASTIMNRKPAIVPLGTSQERMLEIMKSRAIRQLPVVDNENRPVRLEVINSVIDNLSGQGAIVMAGGLGTRLRPLTLDTPKPLLHVGGKPILDHILSGLSESGMQDVIISVNYLGGRIKDYVGDGHEHNLNVEYLNERNRLGTAGALSLIRPRPKKPFLVMNGDLLTKIDFQKILRFQRKNGYTIVMCVQKRKVEIPYGVVEINEGEVSSLSEKPVYEHFINAGIYTLDPSCLTLIPKNSFFDMPDLINAVMENGGTVGAFPIIEYWRDIGTPEDLTTASREHPELCIAQ